MIYQIVDNLPVPISINEIRSAYPEISFPSNPNDDQLASYISLNPPLIVVRPIPTEPPNHNSSLYSAKEVLPEFINGKWQQKWELVQIPPQQQEPNWDLFESLAIRDTSFDNILGMGLQPGVAPAASVTLSDAMREIKIRGEIAVPSFRNSWTRLCRKVNAPQEEIQRFAGAAIACNLPPYFVQAILAPLPEE